MFTSGVIRAGALALALIVGICICADRAGAIVPVNPQLVKLKARSPSTHAHTHTKRDGPTFPVYNFTQPLDHFSDTGFSFQQRYWVSDRHYKPGGPVIVFEAGEGSGAGRMPILDTGIIDILANATNGLGIVLEHRYYGKSIPVLNLTTDSLRWLNNEQAAADSANFIANVAIPGIDEDITAPGTPWIYYGGSYGGARAAHMRVLYPDLVFGAIASSGVTHATIDDWRYYDIIRQYAPQDCVARIEQTVDEVDALLSQNNDTRHAIKAVFGLDGLTHDFDFAGLLSSPLSSWQGRNWDPAEDDSSFFDFCDALGPLDNATVTTQGITISNATAQYANYINQTYSSTCPIDQQDTCFGSITDPGFYNQTDISQAFWRPWHFQVCTQWGFFSTAPPDPNRPRLVSKLVTKEYAHLTCDLAYPPGEHFTVPLWPNVEDVNRLGGYNIAYDRLAIIDGQEDPWRGDTPHSPDPRAHNRTDTPIRPFKLIPTAVHHWDENGLADPNAEPAFIQTIHHQEVAFVTEWLKDFKPPPSAR